MPNTLIRKFIDRILSSVGLMAILTLIFLVLVLLLPIIIGGLEAFVFQGTVEYRRVMLEQFGRGNKSEITAEIEKARQLKEPIYRLISDFERGILIEPQINQAQKAYRAYKQIFAPYQLDTEKVKNSIHEASQIKDLFVSALESSDKTESIQKINQLLLSENKKKFIKTPMEDIWKMAQGFKEIAVSLDFSKRDSYRANLEALKNAIRELLGPFPDDPQSSLLRGLYGQTRWKQVKKKLHELLYIEDYVYDQDMTAQKIEIKRKSQFLGTPLENLFTYFENRKYIRDLLRPRLTFYGRFLTDASKDSHFFGGIWPELLGTCYLTFGCMILVIPLGIIAAIYLAEYAKETFFIKLIRTCINTLAAVPSIVFGLFGLAFFINTIHLSSGKSVLVGSATLALLVLPVIIRTSEEAIRSVPHHQKEASLALGAGLWRTIICVIIPSAMPGILTGVIIGLGRAAGETAPIIFTAAVSVGSALSPFQALSNPMPALSWNLYNLCTEHEAVEQIRHVQYGMALSLVLLVLLFNGLAMYLRARFAKKLRRG